MGIPGRARLGVEMLVLSSCAGFASCAGKAEPQVTISAVSPAAAYSDDPINLVIDGAAFRPIYDIDVVTGRETAELGAFTAFIAPSDGMGPAFPADSLMWVSASRLAADLPPQIPAGTYDVEVRDPRGSLARLPRAFVSLGPDLTPPAVKIQEPAQRTIVNPGAEVPVAFTADDGLGYVTSMAWKVSLNKIISGTCPVPPYTHRATCRFVFVVPPSLQNGQPLAVVVTAADATAPAQDQTTLAVGFSPVALAFGPAEGPANGGTLVSVHGRNFIAGTQVLVGGAPLQPNGGELVNDTLIQGMTAAHDPGLATVTVQTGAASVVAPGTFTFVGQPAVRAIAPAEGPPAGCTRVAVVGKNFREGVTHVWFAPDMFSPGPSLLCPVFVSSSRIEGYMPPGAGAVWVLANDSTGGTGGLKLGFTYLDQGGVDVDAGAPVSCPCDGGAP